MMDDTGDFSWGPLADTEHFGRECKNYIAVDLAEFGGPRLAGCTHAAHCMFYAKCEGRVFQVYNPRIVILMQMRFDGYLGFPGGLVDEGEDVLAGLHRELVEEMRLDVAKFGVKVSDLVTIHHCPDKNLCVHLFARQISMADLVSIEEAALKAEHYGTEVMGTIRVPLYTMGDGYRGFPAFISNLFVGNSKEQLFCALKKLGVMSAEEISVAQSAKPKTIGD